MTNEFWKDRTALITGAAGYLGHTLADELRRRGARVLGVDVATPKRTFAGEVFVQDLRDAAAMASLLEKHDVRTCFHLAGQAGVAESHRNPVAAFEANAVLTWSLLEACRRAPRPPEVVAVSSNHVYGDQEHAPTPESAALNATQPYAASKACGDIAARCFAASYGLPVAIARITNTYGSVDPHSKHLVTGTILAALRGERPVITGHPLSQKGYLFIDDTIGAFIHLAERIGPLRLAGEAFNFCPDEPITVRDMMLTVLRVAGRADLAPVEPKQPPEHPEREHLSNRKAADILGWRPAHSLEDGLKRAVAELAQATGTTAPSAGKAR